MDSITFIYEGGEIKIFRHQVKNQAAWHVLVMLLNLLRLIVNVMTLPIVSPKVKRDNIVRTQ